MGTEQRVSLSSFASNEVGHRVRWAEMGMNHHRGNTNEEAPSSQYTFCRNDVWPAPEVSERDCLAEGAGGMFRVDGNAEKPRSCRRPVLDKRANHAPLLTGCKVPCRLTCYWSSVLLTHRLLPCFPGGWTESHSCDDTILLTHSAYHVWRGENVVELRVPDVPRVCRGENRKERFRPEPWLSFNIWVWIQQASVGGCCEYES